MDRVVDSIGNACLVLTFKAGQVKSRPPTCEGLLLYPGSLFQQKLDDIQMLNTDIRRGGGIWSKSVVTIKHEDEVG